MCDDHSGVSVFVRRGTGWTWKGIDECIAHLVSVLNHNGFPTVASCCGHGHRPGTIALADGRELIIAPDYDTARQIEDHFPLTSYGETREGADQ